MIEFSAYPVGEHVLVVPELSVTCVSSPPLSNDQVIMKLLTGFVIEKI